jgi:hypothetical protein
MEADMAKQHIITPEDLRKLLRYDPETGKEAQRQHNRSRRLEPSIQRKMASIHIAQRETPTHWNI